MRWLVSHAELLFLLQVAALAAACSTSSSPTREPGATGSAGAGGSSGSVAPVGSGGAGGLGGSGAAGGGGGERGEGCAPRSREMVELEFPAGHEWLNDPCNWEPLPAQDWDDVCTFWTGVPDRMQFPVLQWESCGEGCERAQINRGYERPARGAALSLSVSDGTPVPHLRLVQAAHALPDQNALGWDYNITLYRTIDLLSGETVAAIMQVAEDFDHVSRCSGSQVIRSALGAALSRRGNGTDGVVIRGSWSRSSRSWVWQEPWISIEERGFNTGSCSEIAMEDGGRTLFSCGYSVRAAITRGSSDHVILDSPGSNGFGAREGDALGDLAVWAELGAGKQPNSRVRAWRPDGNGVRSLRDAIPHDTCGVGLSDTHVAGFATSNACYYFNHEGRFWIAERGEGDTLTNFRLGPVFTERRVADVGPPKVWGDFIAQVFGPEKPESHAERQQLLLARTTDWAMRVLRAPEGHEMWVTVLDDEHVYFVPTTAIGAKVGQFTHVYRYALDRFDSIGEPVTPVADPPTATD